MQIGAAGGETEVPELTADGPMYTLRLSGSIVIKVGLYHRAQDCHMGMRGLILTALFNTLTPL